MVAFPRVMLLSPGRPVQRVPASVEITVTIRVKIGQECIAKCRTLALKSKVSGKLGKALLRDSV